MNIQKTIAYNRKLKGMNQEELAAVVGVTLWTVNKWENGKSQPRPRHIKRLSEVLGVDPSMLLKEEE